MTGPFRRISKGFSSRLAQSGPNCCPAAEEFCRIAHSPRNGADVLHLQPSEVSLMRKAMVTAMLGVMLVSVVGCKDGKMPWDKKKKESTTQMSSKDACAMCPGVQTAKADGTCEKCGMKVTG